MLGVGAWRAMDRLQCQGRLEILRRFILYLRVVLIASTLWNTY